MAKQDMNAILGAGESLWWKDEDDLRGDVTRLAETLGWPANVALKRGGRPVSAPGEAAWRLMLKSSDGNKLASIWSVLFPAATITQGALDPGPPHLWWENAGKPVNRWHYYG